MLPVLVSPLLEPSPIHSEVHVERSLQTWGEHSGKRPLFHAVAQSSGMWVYLWIHCSETWKNFLGDNGYNEEKIGIHFSRKTVPQSATLLTVPRSALLNTVPGITSFRTGPQSAVPAHLLSFYGNAPSPRLELTLTNNHGRVWPSHARFEIFALGRGGFTLKNTCAALILAQCKVSDQSLSFVCLQ